MIVKTSNNKDRKTNSKLHICQTPQDTFDLGDSLGGRLSGGEMILLFGDLGAGKTLFTKGILYALDFDADEVTSPSFTLVNLYRTGKYNVYHIDFWRLDENSDVAVAVGLDEILEEENSIVICEWSERLKNFQFPKSVFKVKIEGDGDDPRRITIEEDGD